MRLPDELDLREIGTGVRWGQSACALLLCLWSGLLIGVITEANSLCPACDGCLLQTHDSLREELCDGVSHAVPNHEGKPLSYIVVTVGTDMGIPLADDITSCLAPGSSFIP